MNLRPNREAISRSLPKLGMAIARIARLLEKLLKELRDEKLAEIILAELQRLGDLGAPIPPVGPKL